MRLTYIPSIRYVTHGVLSPFFLPYSLSLMSTPIEEDADRFDSHPSQERLAWETPELTVVHVEKATQGGPFDINDQDDVFYSLPS